MNLPEEIQQQIMAAMKEVDGEYVVDDLRALATIVAEHCEQYPELLNLIQLNEDAAIESFQKTGEVPPGVKIVQKISEAGSNVVGLNILHAKKPSNL